MSDRKNRRLRNEQLDQRGRNLIRTSALGEAEADQLANSPYLFRRLRARIAARCAERTFKFRWQVWALPAAALILVVIGLNVIALIGSLTPESTQPTPSAHPEPPTASTPPPPSELPSPPPTVSTGSNASLHTANNRPETSRPEDDEDQSEVTTEFLPVTYWGDSSALQRGQLLRVELPRSALRLFGLPVDETHLNHRIKADVVLSDDGLVLAIRFLI